MSLILHKVVFKKRAKTAIGRRKGGIKIKREAEARGETEGADGPERETDDERGRG